MIKELGNKVLSKATVGRLTEFVEAYIPTLVGDVEVAQKAISTPDNFNTDIPTAEGNKCLEKFEASIMSQIIEDVGKMFPNSFVRPSGHFLYPAKGGYMGWHTNSDSPLSRLYIVYATEDGKSFFRYRDPSTQEIITCWDKKGINLYYFDTPEDPLFWHCVYAECDRFSFGFKII